MIGIVQDKTVKGVMMWLTCIISLALCLHFNAHVAEATNQGYSSNHTDLVHFHDVQQKQTHSHHDNFHEHYHEFRSAHQIGWILIVLSLFMMDWVKAYLYLIISRIFKPPKTESKSLIFV
uniref:hypothetical protein n=1 Tax=uncultured Acinetobacter sp. TaxID=165433 RepID=UPI00262A1775|nr:hypothetical protein [uncultured Acinetobacter sp.]